MREYNSKVLRKVQLTELEILKKFDAICRKYDIPYVIFYGAGIGALRHRGFVPWDDDIDVMLMREDFERFCHIAKEQYSEAYYLANADESINWPVMASHWGPKNTSFVSTQDKNVPCKFTIFLDIFPLDAISDNNFKRKKQCYETWFWSKLMILRQISHPPIHYHGLKRKVFYFVCGLIHISLKICHISPKWLYGNCKRACLRYKGRLTQEVAFLADTYPEGSIFSKDELFPPRYLEFEGIKLPFPRELEKLLTRYYGDYMQMPPEEDRKNHLPCVLDFGDGERYENDE